MKDSIERINKILVRYGESAMRYDIRAETNVYLAKELLKCNMEDSSLLAILERFLQGNEPLGYIHDVLKTHYQSINT